MLITLFGIIIAPDWDTEQLCDIGAVHGEFFTKQKLHFEFYLTCHGMFIKIILIPKKREPKPSQSSPGEYP
jgi:hypothetical protein